MGVGVREGECGCIMYLWDGESRCEGGVCVWRQGVGVSGCHVYVCVYALHYRNM